MPKSDYSTPGQTYSLKSLTTESGNVLDLHSLSGHDVQINGQDVTGEESYTLNVDTIDLNQFIRLTVDGQDINIRTQSEGLSGYKIDNKGAEEAYIISLAVSILCK